MEYGKFNLKSTIDTRFCMAKNDTEINIMILVFDDKIGWFLYRILMCECLKKGI